jgi:2-methylcitrate dehydratase PrpD
VHLTRKQFLDLTALGALGSGAAGSMRDRLEAHPLVDTAAPSVDEKKGNDIKGITSAVVDFITTANLQTFPPDVVGMGKRCLIDGFGVVLAGSTVRGSAIVREYVKAATEKSEASVLGPKTFAASAALAALANGASGHAMDWDDTQLSTTPDRPYGLLTHPTVPALAGALAVAERMAVSGGQFLEAFLTGFEVECKIAEAIDPAHYLRGFHTTGTVGTFGAAVAAAKLMKLDKPQLAHTLAIAASLASGIRVNFGSMTKPLHAGHGAHSGVLAAELASRGFTGGADGLDGQWGFFQVCGGGADPARILGVLGKPHTIVDPGISIKPYPCGVLSHPSMDAMLKIVTDNSIKPDDVKSMRVRAGSNILEPLRYKTAKTELEAKFCLPFLMTSIVLRRKAGIREFTDEFVSSEPVQRMMPLVQMQFDPEIEARGFDKIRIVVEVYLKDGRSFVQPTDDKYRGGPDRPFTRAELHEKFTDCASLTLSPARIKQALAAIESVDRLKTVRELVAPITAPDAPGGGADWL